MYKGYIRLNTNKLLREKKTDVFPERECKRGHVNAETNRNNMKNGSWDTNKSRGHRRVYFVKKTNEIANHQ